jgi:hypothetical protein
LGQICIRMPGPDPDLLKWPYLNIFYGKFSHKYRYG